MDQVRRPEGCRLAHIATMKITEGVLGYETPTPLIGLEEISTTPIYAELKAFSDNQQDTSKKKHIGTEVSLTVRQLDPAIEAILMGNKYKNGRKYSSQNDVQTPVALLYQETLSDGSYTNIVIYNVTLSRESRKNTGVTDAVEFDRVVLVGTGIPISTGEIEMTIDSLDSSAVPADLENFFTKVLLPTDTPVAANEAFNISMHQMMETYIKDVADLKAKLEMKNSNEIAAPYESYSEEKERTSKDKDNSKKNK